MVEDQNKDEGLENKGNIMGKEIAKWMQVKENREMLRDALNREVNIPIIDENLEEKVFGTMLDVIAKVMESAFND
jgi:hypothetical protein